MVFDILEQKNDILVIKCLLIGKKIVFLHRYLMEIKTLIRIEDCFVEFIMVLCVSGKRRTLFL